MMLFFLFTSHELRAGDTTAFDLGRRSPTAFRAHD